MVEQGGHGPSEGEAASVYSSYGKDLRSARKDADVGKQKGESCAGVGERLKTRGVARTWKQ